MGINNYMSHIEDAGVYRGHLQRECLIRGDSKRRENGVDWGDFQLPEIPDLRIKLIRGNHVYCRPLFSRQHEAMRHRTILIQGVQNIIYALH